MPLIEKLGVSHNQPSFQVVGQNGEIVLNHVADHRNRSGGVSDFERAVPQAVHEIVNQFRQKCRKPFFIKEEKIEVGGEAEFTTAEAAYGNQSPTFPWHRMFAERAAQGLLQVGRIGARRQQPWNIRAAFLNEMIPQIFEFSS